MAFPLTACIVVTSRGRKKKNVTALRPRATTFIDLPAGLQLKRHGAAFSPAVIAFSFRDANKSPC
jgi:hypothetical protein